MNDLEVLKRFRFSLREPDARTIEDAHERLAMLALGASGHDELHRGRPIRPARRRTAVTTGLLLAAAIAAGGMALARDDTPWEPGVITNPVEQVQFLRHQQDELAREMNAALSAAETDSERAVAMRLRDWIQVFLDERIVEICASLDAEEAAAAGC